MSVITDTARGLIQRRLWPVAVALAAGVAAVPFVLASEPAEVPAATNGTAALTSASDDITTKLVSVADAAERERGRRVLGTAKDPFAVAVSAKAGSSEKKSSSGDDPSDEPASSSESSGESPGGSGSSGSSATPAATATATPEPTATVTPAPIYPVNSLSVRWGAEDTAEAASQVLERLEPLPDADQPAVIYLGLLEDGKTAAFLLDETVTAADGDGKCLPRPEDCQTVQMKAGQTEFFDVAAIGEDGEPTAEVAQYQLDVVKVHAKRTSSKAKALAAYAKESKAGRKALRARLARSRRYRYDASTGRVKQLRGAELRRVLARAAARR